MCVCVCMYVYIKYIFMYIYLSIFTYVYRSVGRNSIHGLADAQKKEIVPQRPDCTPRQASASILMNEYVQIYIYEYL